MRKGGINEALAIGLIAEQFGYHLRRLIFLLVLMISQHRHITLEEPSYRGTVSVEPTMYPLDC